MKNVVFQYFLNFNGVGKQGMHYPTSGTPEWATRSVSYFKQYAERHNADHFFMEDRFVNATSNFFEVLRLYQDPIFDQYDNLLYVDVDVMPKNMDSNIFDLDVKDVAGWPEWGHPDVAVSVNWAANSQIKQRFEDFGSKIVAPTTVPNSIRMINSGVMLWTRESRLKARQVFDDHEKWFHHKNALLDQKWVHTGHSSHCLDQPFINAMWNKFDYDVMELGIEWNRFPTKSENRPCNFAHYVGDSRYNIPKMYKEISR